MRHSIERYMRIPSIPWFLLLFFALILSQTASFSCPVCFGALDDPATNGMNIAIFTLLGVTGSVLAALISFLLRIRKLSRLSTTERGEA